MAVSASNPSPRRILATGFAAFLALYVLTAVWVVVSSDRDSAATKTARVPASTTTADPGPASVAVAVDEDKITLTGVVASLAEARSIARLVHDRTSTPLVVNLLTVDPATTGHPDLDALLEDIERLALAR